MRERCRSRDSSPIKIAAGLEGISLNVIRSNSIRPSTASSPCGKNHSSPMLEDIIYSSTVFDPRPCASEHLKDDPLLIVVATGSPPLRCQCREIKEPVILSFSHLHPEMGNQQFRICASHPHYRLYQEAYRHFEAQPLPPWSEIWKMQPESVYEPSDSFKALVGVVADTHCVWPDKALGWNGHTCLPASSLVFAMISVIALSENFLATRSPSRQAGPIPYVRRSRNFPLTFALERSVWNGHATASEADLCQAAFLDTLTAFWESMCHVRRRALWSPMPWSRASSLEPPSCSSLVIDAPTFFVDSEGHGADYDSSNIRFSGCAFGRFFDIPWLGAPHDGYPLCTTLSDYVRIRRIQNTVPTPQDDAALWVSSMILGVLEIITEGRIPEEVFLHTRKSDAAAVLSGAHLAEFALHFFIEAGTSTEYSNNRVYHQRGMKIARTLARALSALQEEVDKERSLLHRAGTSPRMVEDVILSLGTALSTLCNYAARTWDGVAECQALLREVVVNTSCTAVVDIYRRRMLEAGWCPYTLAPFFGIATPPILTFSNMIGVRPLRRQRADEHQDCTASSCVFYNIDTKVYSPRHVDSHCSCQFISPPIHEIVGMLSGGAIPVVIFDGRKLVVRRASEVPYIAISHVWADGLGSTTEDGLPRCQVARLSGLARRMLPQSGAFWMDSLCIPQNDTVRKRAIQYMAKTYSDAAKVLVLDVSVRARCSRDTPWEEKIFYFAASGWMRRVWTLQEGILARELYLEFADGLFDVRDLQLYDGRISHKDGIDTFATIMGAFQHSIFPFFSFLTRERPSSGSHFTLQNAIELLRNRTTTKHEDETVAIAGLLGVDVSALLAITGPDAPARRMKALLLQMKKIPRSFPTVPFPKLDFPSFRWAPRSLAEAAFASGEDNGDDDSDGICTGDGLLAEYAVCKFGADLHFDGRDVLRRHARELKYLATLHHRATDAYYYLGLNSDLHLHPDQPSFVDGLLFIGDALPTLEAHMLHCALVCRRREQGSGSGSRPLLCTYMSTAQLHRVDPQIGGYTGSGSVLIDVEVEKAHVKLS